MLSENELERLKAGIYNLHGDTDWANKVVSALDELAAARKVVEAARKLVADAIKSSAYVKPGTKHAALIAAVRAYHQQRPIPPAGSHATVFESD